mmetsp:Transcript_15914/g.52125  ORF Transcript_15914/g.52125 Transcript_15914/m.52125 type:complete len:204 (+) Transcript_15914:887-1498(+)
MYKNTSLGHFASSHARVSEELILVGAARSVQWRCGGLLLLLLLLLLLASFPAHLFFREGNGGILAPVSVRDAREIRGARHALEVHGEKIELLVRPSCRLVRVERLHRYPVRLIEQKVACEVVDVQSVVLTVRPRKAIPNDLQRFHQRNFAPSLRWNLHHSSCIKQHRNVVVGRLQRPNLCQLCFYDPNLRLTPYGQIVGPKRS